MQKWCALGNSEAQSNEYFSLYKLQNIRNFMTAELCTIVGIGVLPKPYTQNAKKSLNSVLKRGKQTRSLTLKSIVQLLRSVKKRSRGASETFFRWKYRMDTTKIVQSVPVKSRKILSNDSAAKKSINPKI